VRARFFVLVYCVCVRAGEEREIKIMWFEGVGKNERARHASTKFFFLREERPPRAVGLESFPSLVFQSATLELPRALSRLFSLGRERQIKKKRSKNPKEEGLRRELGGKNKTYIYTRHVYIYHARTHRKRAKTQNETSAATTTSRERPFC